MLVFVVFQVFLLLTVVLPPHTTLSHLVITTSAGHAIPFPPFEQLNIKKSIAATKLRPRPRPSPTSDFSSVEDTDHGSAQEAISRNSSVKLNLVHRDKISFSWHKDHRSRFASRMKRDATRVASLIHRLSSDAAAEYEVAGFGSEVVSGMKEGSGEYFVRIGVGSPARSQYMVIDTGSDIVWVQCQPCRQCYHQSDPVFDPVYSASFSGVSCSSTVCDRVENSGCHSGWCKYEVSYGDGSYTKGNLALETLTIGHTMVQNVAIGCGHINRGMFVGASGLLGLGGGSMSIVGQLGGQTGGAFSYCLVSRGTESSGSLEFGRSVLPVGAAWVPLLRNPRAPSFYYIGLLGLGVGGERVPLPDNTFQITEFGDGGVVMDTGTAVTRLPTEAYVAFRDTFIAETGNLPRARGVSIFDTCYDLGGFITVRVPTVSFFLSGGPILTLPARNFLIPVDESGTFCFAFAPSSSRLSIIGNIQQEGIQISFDGANGFVGFGPNVC
ncbi:protein ASPARTIC PROTEASE IN GUARD CELL 2-like [Primulina eburnea]|uniref:protein ASPARTIC PROTEASE IN GUARD CELL 2-like n=1 Tax=Primulina eburnea TaxID=1245227 RepID=UPI003C6C1399